MLINVILADDPLFRVHARDLSDQMRMEILIGDLDEVTRDSIILQVATGHTLDACCEWNGVMCDGDGNVTRIAWEQIEITGHLSLDALPPNLTHFHMASYGWVLDDGLVGTLSTATLPVRMQAFLFHKSSFSGTVDFSMLPPKMQMFDVFRNRFTGSAALDKLPASLLELHIAFNLFTGTINLSDLPKKLRVCDLCGNRFYGNIDVSQLPKSLSTLNLKDNALEGTFCYDGVRKYFRSLKISGTKLVPVGKGKTPRYIS